MFKKDNQNQQNYQVFPEPTVGPIIYNDKQEILLIQSHKWGELWHIPRGHIEFGETSEEALKREIKEKTGLEIDYIEFIGWQDAIYPEFFYKKKHFVFLDFCAKLTGGEIVKSNEMKKWIWIKSDKALKELKIDSFTIKTIQFYLQHQEKKDKNYAQKYKRALADYQNLIKQTAQEKQDFIKYANKHLIQEILPVYDNLKLAIRHIEIGGQALNSDIIDGIKHIIKQFKKILENVGVEEIKTIGEKFDHHTMEAVEGKGERVVREIKTGYKLYGKVIAAAKVVVE